MKLIEEIENKNWQLSGKSKQAASKTTSAKRKKKTVKHGLTVPDESGAGVYHVYNFNEGGFLILAADKRVEPVLAYSDNGDFVINTKNTKDFPSGLVWWLEQSKEKVKTIKKNRAAKVHPGWDLDKIQKILDFDVDVDVTTPNLRQISDDYVPAGGGCTDKYWEVKPLLSTTWGQGCGFNSTLTSTCTSGGECGKAYTGCVATAMAQIMKGKRKPSSFAWSNMPDGRYGNTTIANLMKDIGAKVGMDYGCSGSSATMVNAQKVFKNNYAYTSATLEDYRSETVKDQLGRGYSVILSGGRNAGWWIFSKYTDGHAWVCDGYRSAFYCVSSSGHLYLHMNWGWNEIYNGYFAYNDFTPNPLDPSSSYNYKPKMLYKLY